jgi:hypothetical protein
MKKNVGNLDRGFRVVLALVLAVLYFTGMVTGTLGIVVLVAAVILLATSFVSFCPIYALLGMNTCPKK